MSSYRYFFCGPCGAMAKANAARGMGLSTIIWAPLGTDDLLHCGQWANESGLHDAPGCGERATLQAAIDDYVGPLMDTEYIELPCPTESEIESTCMVLRWREPGAWEAIKDEVRANRGDLATANSMFTQLFIESGFLASQSTAEKDVVLPDFSKFRLAIDIFDKLVQEVEEDLLDELPEDEQSQDAELRNELSQNELPQDELPRDEPRD